MLDSTNIALVQEIKSLAKGRLISTAESCTGGLVASYLTSVSGSSIYFNSSIICYSNASKVKLLNIDKKLINQFGSVSEPVAKQMALSLMKLTNSHVVLSITGIAGPKGGTKLKPVGMVCFGVATSKCTQTLTRYLIGSRDEIREQCCKLSLQSILAVL